MESSSSSPPPTAERSFIDSWQPEPLVPALEDPDQFGYVLNPRVVTSKPGKHIVIDGCECLNAGTNNYLGLAESPRLEKAALEAVRHYGVGSCGPRAFYGTMDAHLELEEQVANFLNVQEAAVYSFGFATIASAIPAYAKATDIIYFDEQCNFAIQRGIVASRSRAIKFKHNDADDLEIKIDEVAEEQIRKYGKPKAVRTFLIVEGIYANTGDICHLKQLNEVAKRHKIRLFIDESRSFGVLGREGKGITQHLNVDINDVDLIMVSLENALCSYGGFCAGSSYVVDHQRLAGSGYCFSASLPPFQCRTAQESLRMIEDDPSIVRVAQELFVYADEKLSKLTNLKNISDPLSPIKVIVKRAWFESEKDHNTYVKDDVRWFDKICAEILRVDRIAIPVARYLDDEEMTSPIASIRLILNGKMSWADVDRIFAALERSSFDLT
jgi:serine palmitoyltransferase